MKTIIPVKHTFIWGGLIACGMLLGGCKKVLEFRGMSKRDHNKATQYEAGKNTQSTQGWNRGIVDFPGVRNVVQFFALSDEYNNWYCQESNGKGIATESKMSNIY